MRTNNRYIASKNQRILGVNIKEKKVKITRAMLELVDFEVAEFLNVNEAQLKKITEHPQHFTLYLPGGKTWEDTKNNREIADRLYGGFVILTLSDDLILCKTTHIYTDTLNGAEFAQYTANKTFNAGVQERPCKKRRNITR